MVIFSFGVLAGVALLGAGFRWEGQAELATELTVAAEMKIEELRAVAGTELADTVELVPGGDLDSNVTAHWDTVQIDGRSYTRRWVVEPGPVGTRRVAVRAIPRAPAGWGEAELRTHILHD